MLEGKAVIRETDMPEAMQSHVMELAYQALDLHEVSDCQSIAQYIKQKFDEAYGPAWHCVVGNDFGSCITHICGCFIFFRVEMMEFLIFKDGKDLTETREEAIGVLQNSETREKAVGVLQNSESREEAIGVLQNSETREEAIGVLQNSETREEAKGVLQSSESREEDVSLL